MHLWDYAKLSHEELTERILCAKKKLNAVILAHNYQRIEIQRIADFRGDSLELARKATAVDARIIVFCGVMFMAETAKILNPKATVLIPELQAGCPLAAHASADDILMLRERFPTYSVVIYINSSAEAKAVSHLVCTSSNAAKVVHSLPGDKGVIFVPDKNLCHYVKTQTRRKNIICWDGHCYVHDRITVDDVKKAREKYPDCVIIVHPECPPSVQDVADVIASTSGMLQWAKDHIDRTIVLGTEIGMVDRIRDELPNIKVFPMVDNAICSNMKLITLAKLARTMDELLYPVEIEEDIAIRARTAIERMLEIA